MHKRAFDAALRAALKITFSTSLLACGGTVDVEESTPPEVGPEEPGATSAASSGGDGGGSVALPTPTARPEPRPEPRRPRPEPREQCEADLAPPVDWSTFDAHTFACCSQTLDTAIPEGDLTAWMEASFDDVPTQNCCTQVISPNMEALWTGQPLPHPAADGVLAACCDLQFGTPTCTAWGPPTPPAMAAADWAAWLALGEEDAAPVARERLRQETSLLSRVA